MGRRSHGATSGPKRDRRKSPEYISWQEMRARCTPGTAVHLRNFANYGARGISVCDRWRASFANFIADMGPKPTSEHTIDRIDNDRGYEPGNCRWASKAEQRKNSRTARALGFQGETLTLAELSARTGIGRTVLARRIDRGMSVDEAVAAPVLTHAEAASRARGGWGGARVSQGLKHTRRPS